MSKDMVKIATLTFHNALSIGAALQTYALHKALKNLGVATKVIDYRSQPLDETKKILKIRNRRPAGILKALAAIPIRHAMVRKFNQFLKNIDFTASVASKNDLKDLSRDFDKFIVGSDQVWNTNNIGFDGTFFLDFVDKPTEKFSYAASLGASSLSSEAIDAFKPLLADFDEIAVRESSGVEIIRSITGKSIHHTLDPVFLIKKEDWSQLADTTIKVRGKYLLIFCANNVTDEIIDASRKIAQKKGLKIVCVALSLKTYVGVKMVRSAGPSQFLRYVSGAEYVVTDSFHATAFSVIFNKDFSLKVVEQFGNKNNRSLELMEMLGLESRLVDSTDSSTINWHEVNSLLQKQIDISAGFLSLTLKSEQSE